MCLVEFARPRMRQRANGRLRREFQRARRSETCCGRGRSRSAKTCIPLTRHAGLAQLGAMPTRAALFDFLQQQLPAGLEMLRRMVAINSFTGNREGVNQVGRLTAEYFAALGFTAEFVPSNNPAWG